MRRVLFVDLTPFYGGGQKFIFNIQQSISNDAFFIVSDNKLYKDLKTSRKFFIEKHKTLFDIIKILNNYIKNNDINTVLLNGNRPIYLAPFINAPVKIAYKHTSNAAIPIKKRLFGAIALNLSYLFCKKIILLYQKAKSEVLFQKSKVVIINNGIDIETDKKTSWKSDKTNIIKIVCVSRLDENKGIEWLINVFNKVLKNHTNVMLEIAGNGVMYEYFAKKIELMKLSNVLLLGFIDKIDDLLATADIFVLPSKFEAFPLSILEAMSFSLPVIATDVGGISDMVISGKNGFLIEYQNDISLENSMVELVNNNKLRIEMGLNSLKLVKEKFLLKDSIKKLEDILND